MSFGMSQSKWFDPKGKTKEEITKSAIMLVMEILR
jgi:hypothetical protein